MIPAIREGRGRETPSMTPYQPDRCDSSGCFAEAGDDDESGVCSRPSLSVPAAESARAPARARATFELGDRTRRVEQKVRLAREWLSHLPGDDPQARLLRVAALRRDELLLDGVLTQLQGRQPAFDSPDDRVSDSAPASDRLRHS